MTSYAETFTIGDVVRKETEIAQGSTLQLTVQVPGGTIGKTFSSEFRHNSYVNSTTPAPVQGIDLAGSFSVTVLDSTNVFLSTPTGTLLPGRYLYSVRAMSGSTVDISSTREFIVISTSQVSGGLPPLAPGADATALVNQHNNDPLAHNGNLGGGGGSGQVYTTAFTQADLSTAGVLVKLHGLTIKPSSVTVADDTGQVVSQSSTVISFTSVAVDLFDFAPITGTWQISATV